jgi:hypothetical protein
MQMSFGYTWVRTFALGGALVCLATGAVLAERGSTPGARTLSAEAVGTVRGVVWTADNSPVPNARVRLRDLQDGRLAAETVTTVRGEFVFDKVHRASYITEVVDERGKVIAVGQSFTVDSGATVATFVRLPARRSWMASAFTNTAAAVIAAASSAGVTAIGSKAPPVSPQ